jgi:methyl-accepting chemotaxis protein
MIAFAGMCYSGLLIHLGNGMIEMHFHVFIMLAIMIVFAMQTPVLTAVVTIAVHHIAFFFLFPESVFNYKASFGIVVLHAVFVILEAIPVFLIATKFKFFIDLQDTTLTQLVPISKSNFTMVRSIEEAGRDLDQTARQGHEALHETKASIDGLSGNVQRNSENSSAAKNLSKDSKELVTEGYQDVQSLLESIKSISGSTDRINDIVSIIDDIAFQTNLLALNAAVEAARAGEHGRGFGVVADAVRSLAQKCAASAKDISVLVKSNVDSIEKSDTLAESSIQILNKLQLSIDKVFTLNTEVAGASEQQAHEIHSLKASIESLLTYMAKISSSSEQLATGSSTLSQDARSLNELIGQISHHDSAVDGDAQLRTAG